MAQEYSEFKEKVEEDRKAFKAQKGELFKLKQEMGQMKQELQQSRKMKQRQGKQIEILQELLVKERIDQQYTLNKMISQTKEPKTKFEANNKK